MNEAIETGLRQVLETFGIFEEDFVLELEIPKDPTFGDVTTNVALVLAKRLERKPRELAGEIAAALVLDKDVVSSVEIAGPGFINFRLAQRVWSKRVEEILEAGNDFGQTQAGNGQRINVEFVSANPTGPFNIVSARAAAVGSALTRARYAEAIGREGIEVPEDGYQGAYLVVMAKALAAQADQEPEVELNEAGGRFKGTLPPLEGSPAEWIDLPEAQSASMFGRYALAANIAQQRRTCARFGMEFDTWYLESELHESERLDAALKKLQEGDHVFEQDGAVWFRSTAFDDEKDRVLIKADGAPTYFLADIAYHASKHARGFERAIDFFGPDHHGHIPRMLGAMEALGFDPDWLEILFLQQVNLIQDGQPLEMSKRAGRLVTMDQLIEEVGTDVAKFFFLARKNNSHLDFDLDLAKQESNDNPVYYVKYAHARICSVLRNAEARETVPGAATLEDLDRLSEKPEVDLMRQLHELPDTIVRAARSREMSRLTTYAMDVSASFHQFYHQCTILGDDDALTRGRLALCRATRLVLANTLRLIGVSAPERM